MTTVISRLYASADTAKGVLAALTQAGLPDGDVDLILPGGDAAQTMKTALISNDNAAVYDDALSGAKAVVVARVGLMPMGAARRVIEMMDDQAPMALGLANENVYLRQKATPTREAGKTVMSDHPRFLSSDLPRGQVSHARTTQGLGLKLVSQRKKRNSASSNGGGSSRLFWPMPLLSGRTARHSVMAGGRHMSSGFWPMALTSQKHARP
ncbi:MAG: hypothetical protein AB8B51_13200 [Sedimentitalea sp.]